MALQYEMDLTPSALSCDGSIHPSEEPALHYRKVLKAKNEGEPQHPGFPRGPPPWY